MKKVLSIAGSSSMGGAGIQADFKTFQECDVFGMGAITAFVTISPKKGRHIYPQPLEAIEAQCETALSGAGIDALKTGMLYTADHIQYVAQMIKDHGLSRVIVDPVMVTKSGAGLLQEEAVKAMQKILFPTATIVTPNVPEAITLSGLSNIDSVEQMKIAAKKIHAFGPKHVLVKGGRLQKNEAIDVLYDGETYTSFSSERLDMNPNGAGCTFSAAIAAQLAKGASVHEAVKTAKAYITTAIRHAIVFTDGSRRINHAAYRKHGEEKLIEITVSHN